MIEHKTVTVPGVGKIEDKKSVFIGNLVHVETEDEALAFIDMVRKKHYDARHNCYAYIIGEKGGLVRASDDGEPQKTAGQPILSVLTGAGLTNVCCVVTRYFGGTLLGTGGLVRAYTDAAHLALENSEVSVRKIGTLVSVSTDYNGAGKIRFILSSEDVPIGDTEYAENVIISFCAPKDRLDSIIKKITDATGGKAAVCIGDEMYI